MKTLVSGGYFYEGPRWHDGSWWASDFYGPHVLRISEDGTSRQIMAIVEHQPSGLGWLPNGDLLVVSMQNQRLLRRQADGTLSDYADLRAHTSFWANDMVVDRKGRAYIGNLGFNMWIGATPKPAEIVRVDLDRSVHVVARDMLFPNGMIVTPDGATLIVSESFGNRMTAFSIAADGSLRDRRVWAQFGPTPSWASFATMIKEDYAPDGCDIDAEGCVWVADALNNRACRVAEGGRILEEVRTPDNLGIYSCALGGFDGRTLLLCAAPEFDMERCKAKPQAVLLTHRVDVPKG